MAGKDSTNTKKKNFALVENDKSKAKGIELGDTGTSKYQGFIYEEEVSKLRDVEGIKIYDEMRKSDGTVKAAVLACTLPIQRAKWYVSPASDDEADQKVKEFVEHALFDWQTIGFPDILRQALLSLPFGVMLFEKVFETQQHEGQTYITWKKLAPRLPKSIHSWQTSTGEEGVQQRRTDGKLVDIPMEKLLVFVNEKEGDNWWGTSILRAAYKHWYYKAGFYKIDAIAFERQGLGIPYAKLAANATPSDKANAESVLKEMRAHQKNWVTFEEGHEVGFLDMKAGTLRDPSTSIAHHNREIVKSVLAQFLELGSTDSGSRALSTDQTDIFLQAIESFATMICDVFNTYAIPQLVDLNFDVKEYPYLQFTGISRTDVQILSTAFQTLVNTGAVKVGENDEEYFRELLNLPERDMSDYLEDGEAPKPEEKPEEDTIDEEDEQDETLKDIGMDKFSDALKKKESPNRVDILAAIKHQVRASDKGAVMASLGRNISMLKHSSLSKKYPGFSNLLSYEFKHELAGMKKFEEGDFKSFRKLTFAEKKVDFNSIQKTLDQLEASLDSETKALLNEEREKFINRMTRALQKGDKAGVKDAEVKAVNAYAKILKTKMREAFEYGKNNAAKEMGVAAPATPSSVISQIDIQSQAIAELHVAQIQSEAKTKMVEALNKGQSTAQAAAVADAAMAAKIAQLSKDTAAISMAGYVNNGRNMLFETHQDKIYALQRSEILDSATCNYCLSVDGRIVERDDPFAKNTIFHSGCRGIWVEILIDEEELPPIGGIPTSIRDRFGDAINDLIQPKSPQTSKGSLARKEVERRLRRSKK